MGPISKALKHAIVEDWGKVRRTDSEAGDTMRSCSVGTFTEDSRDATYVRVRLHNFTCAELTISTVRNVGRRERGVPESARGV
jgi:hypothetical protein